MDYRYTNEGSMTANLNITLDEMDKLIELLEPITKDEGHAHRCSAGRLLVGIKDARAETIKTAATWMDHLRSALKGQNT